MIKDMKLDGFFVVAGDEHGDRSGLMSYDTHPVTVECFGRDGITQQNQTQSKLFNQTSTDETGVRARVDEGSQGLRSTRQEQAGLE